MQNVISDILLKSRLKAYVFTADITKMYRQILLHIKDFAYQHILCWESPSDEVQEYEVLTVTYDVSSAPFLGIRCLYELDKLNEPYFLAAQGILVDTTLIPTL